MTMGDMGLGPLTWSMVVTTWQVTWSAVAILVLANAYAIGVLRLRRSGQSWPKRRVLAAGASAISLLLAFCSVVGIYDMTLFSMHMVQHLLLVMVGSFFLAASAPVDLALAATSGGVGKSLRSAVGSPLGHLLGNPAFAFIVYATAIPAFHLTNLFNLAMQSGIAHSVEAGAFIVIGYLFWRPVVAVEAAKHPLSPGVRMVYLLLSVPVDTITGLALVMQNHANQLSSFATGSRNWGPSVLSDIHQGGAIMWIIGDLIMMAALVPLGIAFVRADAREAKTIDAQLAAGTLPTSENSAWKPVATSHFPTAPPLGTQDPRENS
jgi:putative copper resistance protein D